MAIFFSVSSGACLFPRDAAGLFFAVLVVPGVVGYSQQLGCAAFFCRGVSGMGLSPNDLPGQLSCTSAQDRVHCQYPVSTAAVWNQCFLST